MFDSTMFQGNILDFFERFKGFQNHYKSPGDYEDSDGSEERYDKISKTFWHNILLTRNMIEHRIIVY